MTTLGGNIHPLRGRDVRRLPAGRNCLPTQSPCGHRVSANSINLLRWIPQAFYYFYGWPQGGSRRAAGGLWSWCRAVLRKPRPDARPPHGLPSADSSRLRTATRGARIPAQRRVPSEAVGADAGQ